ncbi:MAG TPA: Holliday junction resolvase RuvX [Thermoanaerobaculia bacterium]|nr:Holliday junction resolvase RuvX [Thermoanaerobaculia bacterium]
MPVIGVDYGSRRVGIAISDSGIVATPHSVIPNHGDVADAVAEIARELGADLLVVGIPSRTHPDASQRQYEAFAQRLRQKTCKPVVLWDETLTTVDAAEQVRAAGRKRRDAQREIDMHAAAVMLQSYLDRSRP